MKKLRKRMIAVALSVVMTIFCLTAYANEVLESDLALQTEEASEEAKTEYDVAAVEQASMTEAENEADDDIDVQEERFMENEEESTLFSTEPMSEYEAETSEITEQSVSDAEVSEVFEGVETQELLDEPASDSDIADEIVAQQAADESETFSSETFSSEIFSAEAFSTELSETQSDEEEYSEEESSSAKVSETESNSGIQSASTGDSQANDGLVIRFTDNNTYVYTGAAIEPEIEVSNNGKKLILGVDYTVKYSNNVNVPTGTTANKQPKVTVTGKGAFSGSTSANFRITRKNINDADVIKGRIVVVQGKQVSVPTIYYGSVKLTNKDFSYNKATVFNTTGNTTLAITGAGNFIGSSSVDVAVVGNAAAQKENAKKFAVTVDKTKASGLIYTGESLETAIKNCIQVNAKDSAKTNLAANAADCYRIVLPKDVTNAGTVKFTVVGIGVYSGCNVTKSCKILPKTVQSSDILVNGNGTSEAADGKVRISGTGSEAAFTSVGATFENLRLQYGSKDMTEGRDYKVSYSNNKRVADGKAKYTISFMGNYKGKYTSPSFNVTKAELSSTTVDSVALSDKVCSGAYGVYKSNAYVSIDGVTLKASEYEVQYYTDEARTQEMNKENPVKLQNGIATVYVKVIPTAKGNYILPADKNAATGSYTVWTKGGKTTDLSNTKVTFYDAADKKVTKVDYTGKPVRPAKIVVTIGGSDFVSDDANAPYTYEIVNNTNKGKASVLIKAKRGSGYTGGKTASFTVAPRNIKDLLFTEISKEPDQPTNGSKTLIAYFSWSNNTRTMAAFIQSQTGGDLYEIVPVTPYPTEYTPTTEVALEERDNNARPAIKDLPQSIAEYDKILIGYPIWWHTAPMIIGTFLEAYDLSGVDIYPFTQSASMNTGQFNQSIQFVRQCASGAIVHDGLFARATDTAAITAYLTENGLIKEAGEEPPEQDETDDSAVVYMTTDISAEGMMEIYEALGWTPTGNVAVKLSTGEPPASNYLRPELIKDLVQSVNGTIVECNTAYGGSRAETAMHKQVAADHGFTAIADVDILDEDGSVQLPVNGGSRLQTNYVGSHFTEYNSYIVLSHFKGHAMAGFGGAIKNISIGLGSREGKCLIHTGGRSHTSPWGGDQTVFTESMAEAGKSVSDYLGNGERIIYINVLNNISIDCDCDGNPAAPDIHDIGILASTDAVAIDQAAIDLCFAAEGSASLQQRVQRQNGLHTLEHAEEIGLGSRTYRLVSIDE